MYISSPRPALLSPILKQLCRGAGVTPSHLTHTHPPMHTLQQDGRSRRQGGGAGTSLSASPSPVSFFLPPAAAAAAAAGATRTPVPRAASPRHLLALALARPPRLLCHLAVCARRNDGHHQEGSRGSHPFPPAASSHQRAASPCSDPPRAHRHRVTGRQASVCFVFLVLSDCGRRRRRRRRLSSTSAHPRAVLYELRSVFHLSGKEGGREEGRDEGTP